MTSLRETTNRTTLACELADVIEEHAPRISPAGSASDLAEAMTPDLWRRAAAKVDSADQREAGYTPSPATRAATIAILRHHERKRAVLKTGV